MDRKSDGIEFNREAFVASTPKEASAGPRLFIGLLLVVSVAALGLIVYKVLIQNAGGSGGTTDARVVAELDQRLSMIEDRLDQIEKELRRLRQRHLPRRRRPHSRKLRTIEFRIRRRSSIVRRPRLLLIPRRVRSWREYSRTSVHCRTMRMRTKKLGRLLPIALRMWQGKSARSTMQ